MHRAGYAGYRDTGQGMQGTGRGTRAQGRTQGGTQCTGRAQGVQGGYTEEPPKLAHTGPGLGLSSRVP